MTGKIYIKNMYVFDGNVFQAHIRYDIVEL